MANVEIPKWLKNLPLAPVFRPTDTEFADPIAYISKIEKEAGAFGICKVIPPLPKPSKRYVLGNLNKSLSKSRDLGLDYNATEPVGDSPNTVAEGKAVFTTRQQELGKSQSLKRSRDASCLPLSVGQKQVWQSGEVYTLEQFESKSKVFSRSVLGSIKEVTPQVIEALFWKASSEKPIYVEYANDVPGSGFGEPDRLLSYYHGRKRRRRTEYGGSNLGRSGCARQHFNTLGNSVCGGVVESLGQSSCSISETVEQSADNPTSISDEASHSGKQSVSHANGELEGTAGWKLSNSPWNLQVIARSAGSLTRFLLDDIPGVTSPMVYIGMLFSWFAWHVEDHELHSLNFLHLGSPKTWYAVPGDYAFAFEEIIRTQAYGRDIDRLAALKFLGEKTTLLSPELVVASGIPCCRLVQNPGEFVVTFPRAYHVGFSHGFNCGEAANFGTPQWLTVAKDAAIRRAAMDHLPMLSHQQLLYLLTMSFIPRVPRSLLPGVRSSRLKDRLKEERELLVKKAFIKDVLKENKLLKTLSERCFTFRAVLWHPDLLPSIAKESIFQVDFLPSVAKESVPQSGNIQESIPKKDELPVTAVKNSNQDTFVHEITSCAETASDLYNCDDLSCDFQVDSGALPCVACGVLGYPLMSVIQPSTKAAAELFPTERLRITGTVEIGQESKSPYLHQLTNCAVSAINVEETQDTPAFLKPRIFCLEHAIQIEELLRTKGGSKILVICHSDYQKVKVNAATVAEDIRTVFDHKEVPLDSASMEELSLIDIAIEHEQLTDCQEDWTSKLGMNLRYSIKVRTDSSKEIGALNPGYLLSVIAPGSMISSIKWGARKSRTRRESNNQKQRKSCCGDRSNKDETIHESVRSMERRDKVILQYSRRKYRARSRDSGAKCASTSVMNCLLNVADANCGKTDASEVETSVASFVRNIDVDSVELYTLGSTEHFEVQHDEVDVAEPNRNSATSIVHADPVYQHRDTTLQVNLPMANKTSCEVTVATEASTSTSDNSMSLREAGQGNEANNVNGNLASDKCSCSTAVGMLADEKRWNCVYNNIQNDGDSMKADEGMAMVTLEEPSNKQLMGNSVLEKASAKLFEVHDSATSNVSVSKTANETCKYDISVCMESTITVEVSKPAHLENQKNSCQIGIQGCSLQGDSKHDMGRTANTKVVSSGKSKRAREVAQTDILNDFVISPCERLRPRKKTEDPPCTSSHNTLSETQQKPPRKMIKKSSGSSGSHMDVMDGKGPYECNLEGCRLRFKTKTELSLHKRNKCHYEECGKRFRSHKYVVLHQRVHDDKRPLKCMWKGCGMTFKWAWARTEHLRLHTGERPYECKIEGCGRTFRFVSDFSRHRRKTGHYI